ncbi:alpha/beta hydrolase family protein [Variovorax sp. HJSM1_2]|uniref:alpha/beta hydrolase family protein n=1 Tax=Variovorax sp. HJSM1_2 TaxID=3366263 RepID=UPI003BDD5C0C
MKIHVVHLMLGSLMLWGMGQAHAALREEQLDVPVRVQNMYGKEVAQNIKVTVFSDDAQPRPMPVLVLNHGRAVEAEGRAKLGRARFVSAAQYFVRRGFIVAVPTRVGYGVSGGEDVEDSGPCGRKNYPPGFAAAADQILTVLASVQQRPDVDPEHAVVVGQSFGGTSAVAIAAKNPRSVVASINFAGGGGGNPKTRPGQPCAAQQLGSMFRNFGETARVPMLWIYTENDQFFGASLPKEWFDAYLGAGAKADFVQFPPHGEDGHQLFSRFPEVWQPKVGAFLDQLGFKPVPTLAIQHNK